MNTASVPLSQTSQLFREVNERIVELSAAILADLDFLRLVCECPDAGCREVMRMTHTEYASLCSAPDLYAVLPGHADAAFDEIAVAAERYLLVRRRSSIRESLRPSSGARG